MRKIIANKKKRLKKIVGCSVINLETYEMILQVEREVKIKKEANTKEIIRKKNESAKKKTIIEVKKVAAAANRAINKTAKATKKNNRKNKKTGYL